MLLIQDGKNSINEFSKKTLQSDLEGKTVMKLVNGHSPITWAFFNYNHLLTEPSCGDF